MEDTMIPDMALPDVILADLSEHICGSQKNLRWKKLKRVSFVELSMTRVCPITRTVTEHGVYRRRDACHCREATREPVR